jgi:predicted ATPase
VDEGVDGQGAVTESGLSAEEKDALKDVRTTTDLTARLSAPVEPTARQTTFLQELNERWDGGLKSQAVKYLEPLLPKFVYYDQYERLLGRISLNQLLAANEGNTLDEIPGSRVFEALLSMVGSTAEQISEITTSEELISRLEAVQTRLSQKVFKYWSQNKNLKVRFRFDQASPDDPPPYNDGKVFQTRIENTRHEATIRLDERSTGFIWFFSFLVWFSEVQRTYGENLIVLLDEPGLSLHARAQRDLLRYIQEELLSRYQVMYTTHSPFMVDPGNLLICRTVEDMTAEDGTVLGTKVGDQRSAERFAVSAQAEPG